MLRVLEYYIAKIISLFNLREIKSSCVDRTSSIGKSSKFINSEMLRNSFCGHNCVIVNTSVGAFCSISSDCEIGRATHSIYWVSTSPVFNKNKDQIKKKYSNHCFDATGNKTIIGNDVWIGSKVLIKAGVHIGDGAIIGMGSVVTKNVPSYEIWAGNPAKKIKSRFSDEVKEGLIDSKWWLKNDTELKELAKFIKFPKEMIRNIKEVKNG